jgi:regulator of protease activity HflC (stomatin/prohibitin superfamily)
MSWQMIAFIVLASIAALTLVGMVGFTFFDATTPEDRRSGFLRGLGSSVAVFSAGVLFLLGGCFTIVGTRQIAIQTIFGRPTGTALNNGLHGKMPWTITHEMDGAIQIDKYVNENNNDQRIVVRLGNSSTARADASIRWQIKQEAATELFQQYKTFDNVRTNLVERNLAVALNEVFAGYDPLDPQNLDHSPLPTLAKKAVDILRKEVGSQVDIYDINVPTIAYDQGTEDKINQLNQQRAQTSIASEAQKTADAQAKANEVISKSISNDPNVVTMNCINSAIAKNISPLGCWPGSSVMPTIPAGR